MNKRSKLFLCLLLIISLTVTVFTSCDIITGGGNGGDVNNPSDSTDDPSNDPSDGPTDNPDDSTNKRVPVYQGMTISSVYSSSSAIANSNGNKNGKDDFDYEKDNGNHNGHFKGDHDGNDEVVDEDNPFPDNGENENIEEEIKSSLEVIGSPINIYYATPNEDIYIYIHINNPDSFEIMSFTLNGKKYSSYMFEDGSDMETIILKLNVGEVRGIIDYTIDAIKYIDGTEIKDVIIDGDKTVRAGVRVDAQVVATVTDLDIDTNAISFNVFIKDNDSLAEIFGGEFKAVIYDGLTIVSEKNISVGENSVTFDGLRTGTVYQYAIVGYYDDLSGKGFGMNLLYTDAIKTDSVVLFSDITVRQEGIDFGLVWHEDHTDKSISAIKLYKDDKLIKTLDASTRAIDDLLSNNVYTMIAEYENGGKTESIYLDFITATKAVPDFTVSITDVSDSSLVFGITVTDIDSVGAISDVKLIHGTDVIALDNLTVHELTNLLSDNEYTLKVTYTYDLDDDEGSHSIEKELTAKTHAKNTPEFSIVNVNKTQTSVSFDIAETDSANVGSVTKIELIHKSGTTVADNLDVREFTNLLSGHLYALQITYVYDLNDGAGKCEIIKSVDITTDAKAAPDFNITNTGKTQSSLNFEITVTDIDSVGAISDVKLIHGTDVIALDNLTAHELTDLLSDNEYTLKVTYTYDLNNGEGEQSVEKELSAYTESKSRPEIMILNPTKTQTSVGFEIEMVDIDKVGYISKIELIHESGTIVAENVNVRIFENLLSGNTYTLRVTCLFDLNNSIGECGITDEIVITTDAKTAPDFNITNTGKTQSSLNFEITVTDIDSVGAISDVKLIHGTDVITLDNLTAHELTDLLSDNEYTLKVTYTYDLNNGEGEQSVEKELSVYTESKSRPEIMILNPTKTQTSVGFEIEMVDVDKVGYISKIELIHESGTIVAENVNVRIFENLLSGNTYTLRVTCLFDLNNGIGECGITDEIVITTDAKAAPSLSIKNEVIGTDSITADHSITDVDNTLSSYKVELYNSSDLVSENKEQEIDFTSLNYYTDYTVKITYIYNLNDGKGETTTVSDYSFKTLPYIDVTECSIANTSAVSEGETIFMQVKLNNPLKMAIESVVVNGETYSVTGASTSSKIFVEIVYNGQFLGGDTYLKIDKVNAKLDGIDFDVEPESELSDNVFINGKLEVLKIEFVNQDFEHIDWAFSSEKINVMITLNNSTGYNIDSIIESGSKSLGTVTELKKLDDDHWYYELDFVLWAEGVPFYDTSYDVIGWFTKTLESISFSNDYIEKTLTYSSMTAHIYRLISDEVKYISTPDDLKNMSNKCYYELKNDIDLKGIEWQGSQFEGVFDGKGYSIKNMSFVGSVANSDAYIGLFSTGSGYICNLNIEEATFIVEASSDDGKIYDVHCGGIVGATESLYLKLDDCTVDEYSIISIKNTSGDVYAGGLVGASNRQNYTYAAIDISNCTNSGSISATATSGSAYAGGLIGYSVSHECISYITYCSNSGDVSSSYYAGGLIGDASSSAIIKCTNNGSVSADYFAGGLIGGAGYATITDSANHGNVNSGYVAGGLIGNDSASTVTNCTNSGNVSSSNVAGGLIGYNNYNTNIVITNSYSLISGNSSYNGEPCTIEQLNSREFYTETLGWSEDVWDFSELDVENGKYPKLK